MTRHELEKEIATIVYRDMDNTLPRGVKRAEDAADEIFLLFKKAGWKAPDAPDAEKEALIRENFDIKKKLEVAVDYLLSYSTKAFGKDYWQKMIDEKASEK